MGEPIGRSEYRPIEGSYDKSRKELSVGDQKITNVSKGFLGWVGWFFGQNVKLKIQQGEKILFLYVPKKTAQEMTQTTEKIGRKLAEILYKKAIAQPKALKIVAVPLQKQAPKIEEAQRNEIQAELDQNGIPLTCRTFVPLAQPNHMQEEEIQKYLQSLPEEYRAIKGKLFQNVQKISYKELEQALFSCVQELNRILNDKEYAIGYAENKSQKWIAELALQFMRKTPKESFSTYTCPSISGGGKGSKQSHLTGKADNFVVFDDSSYSGTQLCELLEKLVAEIAKQPARPWNICLVVPFMSEPAKKKLQETWDSLSKRVPEAKLHIITSQIKVTSFADKYPDLSPEREELFACEKAELGNPEKTFLGERGEDNKCLAYMEWKTPDHVSIPQKIIYSHPFQIMTNFLPPYKAKK